MKLCVRQKALGTRALRPETLMTRYGYDPFLSEGSVKPPVFLTSTFAFRSAEDGKDLFDDASGRRGGARTQFRRTPADTTPLRERILINDLV